MKLWSNTIPYLNPEAETPDALDLYLLKTDEPRPCVVIFPGGAYKGRAPHEGINIAQFFNLRGFHAAVCQYRVTPNYHPAPLADAQRAVRIMRANAEEWMIDPNRIVTCGFSAGGHLCATTLLFPEAYEATDEIDRIDCHPNGAILGYPVLALCGEIGHIRSGQNLLGDRYEEDKEKFTLAQYVTDDTPPVFLWHTSNDPGVTVKNSLTFAEALRNHNIPFELHVFPKGSHGLGIPYKEELSDVRKWADLAADWIYKNIK
ncbi:MAG: alpha/beta hydrolase [Clostridia bacterium]|nr:alpha/beta hydrolase [Clostridia bacterium]